MSVSIFDGFYDYQLECVEETNNNIKGIVKLPTGTGKTRIQAGIIANDIFLDNRFKIYVVNAPRILLAFQLMKELFSFNLRNNIETISMFVHSGGSKSKSDLEKIRLESKTNLKYSEVNSSTSPKAIKQEIERAQKLNIPIILYSTYNSADRIQYAIDVLCNSDIEIEICMNDEAHFLTQLRFNKLINTLKTKRIYFFTATSKNSESELGLGMNNIDSYGKILYSMSPREAIERGKMCRPRLHFLDTNITYNVEDLGTINNQLIFQAFERHHHKLVMDAYYKKTKLSPKLLVSVKGSKDIKCFLESEEYLMLISKGVNICITSSRQEIGNQINGEFYKRDKFLEKLKTIGEDINQKMLVLHYDILSEGIDVSGFSGFLPLRKLEKAKFLQSIGRVARLNDIDRKNISNGKINPVKPKDLNKMIKPYTWVIVPNFTNQDEDTKQYISNIISDLREYGFNAEEDIYGDNHINGIPLPTQLEGMNYINKRKNNMKQTIEKIKEEFESERVASLMQVKINTYKKMNHNQFLKTMEL